MGKGTGIYRQLRTRGVDDTSDVDMRLRRSSLLLLLLFASVFAVLPLLLQAITIRHLLMLLKFRVVPLVLDSTDLVGLSGLGSILHVVLIPQEHHSLLYLIHSGRFCLSRGILGKQEHCLDVVREHIASRGETSEQCNHLI